MSIFGIWKSETFYRNEKNCSVTDKLKLAVGLLLSFSTQENLKVGKSGFFQIHYFKVVPAQIIQNCEVCFFFGFFMMELGATNLQSNNKIIFQTN